MPNQPRPRPHLPALLAVLLAVAPGVAGAQSGATLTPDGLGYLVNKDIGSDRYTISLNLALPAPAVFLNATGNVFRSDGSPPSFILCQLRPDSTGDLADPSSEFRFTCRGTDSCETSATECAQSAWRTIPGGDDVRLAAEFFLPPGGQGAATAGALRLPAAEPQPAAGGDPSSRGATAGLDSYNFLVNKDLGADRYSISLNFVPVQSGEGQVERRLASVTGNVFRGDGGPPSFIFCTERTDSTGDLAVPASIFRFACVGTDACEGTATLCAQTEWRPIPGGENVELAASFFLPPGGLPPSPQSDPDIVVIGKVSDPPGVAAPLSESSASAAGGTATTTGGGCRSGEACSLRIGSCPAVAGVVTLIGEVCSCLVESPPSSCIGCGSGASGTCGGSCAYAVGRSERTARGTCLPFSADSTDCVCYAVGAGQELAVQGCGGPSTTGCPDDRCCTSDPRAGCAVGVGSSCTGLCVAAGGCDPAQEACGTCPRGIVSGPCENVAGTRSFVFRSAGECVLADTTIAIERTFEGSATLEQTGCSLRNTSQGFADLTGTIAGTHVELSGPFAAVPTQRCPTGSGSLSLGGEVAEGGVIEFDGTAAYVATCDGGSASCTTRVQITSRP